jgi:hypothetical protein
LKIHVPDAIISSASTMKLGFHRFNFPENNFIDGICIQYIYKLGEFLMGGLGL